MIGRQIPEKGVSEKKKSCYEHEGKKYYSSEIYLVRKFDVKLKLLAGLSKFYQLRNNPSIVNLKRIK